MINMDIELVPGILKTLAKYDKKVVIDKDDPYDIVLFDSGASLAIWTDSLKGLFDFFGGEDNCSRVKIMTAMVNGFGLEDNKTYDVYRINHFDLKSNIPGNNNHVRFNNLYVIHKPSDYLACLIFPLGAFKNCEVKLTFVKEDSECNMLHIKSLDSDRLHKKELEEIELQPIYSKDTKVLVHRGIPCKLLNGLTFVQDTEDKEDDVYNNDEPKKMMDLIDPHLDDLY